MSEDPIKLVLRRLEEMKKETDRLDEIEKKLDEIRTWKDEMQAVQGLEHAVQRIDENVKSLKARFERLDKEAAENEGIPPSNRMGM